LGEAPPEEPDDPVKVGMESGTAKPPLKSWPAASSKAATGSSAMFGLSPLRTTVKRKMFMTGKEGSSEHVHWRPILHKKHYFVAQMNLNHSKSTTAKEKT